jgi:hypothetical protein
MASVSVEVRSDCLANTHQKWYRLRFFTRSYLSSKFSICIHTQIRTRIVGAHIHIYIYIYNRINHHIDATEYLKKNQYGFIPQTSTIDAIMAVK